MFLMVIATPVVTLQKAIFEQFSFKDLPTLFDLAFFVISPEMSEGFFLTMITCEESCQKLEGGAARPSLGFFFAMSSKAHYTLVAAIRVFIYNTPCVQQHFQKSLEILHFNLKFTIEQKAKAEAKHTCMSAAIHGNSNDR